MAHMRSTSLIAFALAAAMPALADDPSAASAHEAVRAALLEQATLPVDHPAMPDDVAGPTRHQHAARARHEDAERAAHERAASHGARHSREMRSEHGSGSSMHGPMHGGAGGAGMDSGMDCHDPAGNQRTRGTHDGWMPRPMDMGM
jgi:hypothetical protein